ncbi:MAG: hypothetical protein HC836_15695 [Richelia sp. RM2_1_2]|nr:hypothetical protein [Richelia sp. RM2_1_2]
MKLPKFEIKDIIILVLLLLLFLGGAFYFYKVDKLNKEKTTSEKLNNALTDQLRVYVHKTGLYRYEKLALQEDISKLNRGTITLTEEKKELLSEVKELNKIKDVFAATVIKQQIIIDSLNKITSTGTFIDDNTVLFEKNNNDTLNYRISVSNVARIEGRQAKLNMYSLVIPNTQTIAFGWDKDKRKDYPVSVSVINTNPLFKTYNVEAYAIPELTKQHVDPTFWMKLQNASKTTGGKVVIFGLGVIVGGILIR